MGFGTSGFGISSFGAGSDIVVYPDDQDADPYYIGGYVRWIDPVTKDYERESDKLGNPFRQMKPNMQRVLLALGTVHNSLLTAQEFGDRTLNLKQSGENMAEIVRSLVSQALAFLVQEGAIRILSVDVEVGDGYLKRKVTFVDLIDNSEYPVEFLWLKSQNLT